MAYRKKNYKKSWTAKRRKEQAENCRKNEPWRYNTGPKTDEGKAITAQNAYRHGMRSASLMKLYRAMATHNKFLRRIIAENQLK